MANKVLLKKSSVTGKIPTTTDLDYGELALNYTDGKLYYKTATNTIGAFATGSGTVTSVSGTGTVSGLTLSGTVTSSGNLTLGGTLALTSGDITTGLGYTPLNKAGDTVGGAFTVTDSLFTIQDETDNTKKAQFQLSGITTGTTRTYTLPNASVTLAGTNVANTFSSTNTFSAATVTVGTSTATSTYGLGTGATLSGNTKTVNIGTNGVSGSTTTINIGSTNGTSVTANGTWTFGSTISASITGSSPLLASLGSYVWNTSTAASSYSTGITNSFVQAADGWPSYGSVMTMKSYSGGGGTLQLYTPYGSSYGGSSLQYRTADYTAGEAWTAFKTIIDSSNYASYAVPYRIQTNWNDSPSVINNVVGMLGWKAYGNSHVIFDASSSTSPSGTSISRTDSTYAWGGSYPTLMGWNGSATYGVRVDSARQADVLYSSTSAYATIYYDYDNTAYYLNPNGTSVLYALAAANSVTSGGNTGFYNDVYYNGVRNPIWSFGNATSYGISYFQGAAGIGGSDTIGIHPNGDPTASGSTLAVTYGWTQSLGSMRAPLFYDLDNTGYYVDPASTSSLNRIDTVRSNNDIYIDNNYGNGLVGVYSSYRYQGVFAMGNAYKLPADGTGTGNLYGMAWSHPNAGGTASNLNSHGLLLLQNGSFMAALSTNGTFSADVRGTIFYDYNNTGYYVDPASTSQFASVLADNWFRPQGQTGLYSHSYGQHFYPESSGRFWRATGNGSGSGGMQFYQNYESSLRGYVYWDGDGFGLLHSSGGWAVRTTTSLVELYGNVYAPIIYDSNNTAYYADPASTSNFNVTKTVSIIETKAAIAASAIDVNSGNYFTKTISGATTFTANASSSGNVSSFILELTNAGSAAITWFSGVKWAGGTAPTLTSSGVDILGFYTHDGGTTWRGLVLAKDSK